MFQRFYELSDLLNVKDFKPWELLNQGMPENYERGFAICFDPQGNYAGIKTINSHKGVSDRGVVYLPGPSNNSPPLIPCTRLSAKMETKVSYLFKCTKEVSQVDDLPEFWKTWLTAVDWKNKELIKNIAFEIAERAQEAAVGEKLSTGKTRSGYTFPACYENDQIKPVFELEAAKKLMVSKAEAIWRSYGVREGICSVCGSNSEVFGNFARLKCYSLDKRGMVAGGFNTALAHKNFPVCTSCAYRLSFAIHYVQDRLTASMAGQPYMILPFSSSDPELKKLIKEELELRPNRFSISRQCDLIASHEREFISYIHEEKLKDQLAFSLIFFKESNAEWKIMAEVQQVLPSRMRELQRARKEVAGESVLMISGDQGKRPISISAHSFRLFAGASSSKASDRIICQWLAAVFEGRSIEREPFLKHIVDQLLAVERNPKTDLSDYTFQAWGLYLFARYINFIPKGEERMNREYPNSPFGKYMSEHADFFRCPEVIASFLTGCYINTVCSVQKKERNSKKAPFAKKFLGRLLSRNHLKRLYREGHDKLSQYDKLGYVATGLDPDLAHAWVQCGDTWDISDEEATFAFTVGYSLAYRIAKQYRDVKLSEILENQEEHGEESI